MSFRSTVSALTGGVAFVLLASSGASAQSSAAPAAPEPAVINDPVWTRIPTESEMADVFPHDARRNGISGEAAMRCKVTKAGYLTACETVSESPAGAGFGRAELDISRRFRLDKPKDGTPLEGSIVLVPVRWVAPPRQ